MYYVRALQEPTPAINAGGLRPRFDPAGNVIAIEECDGGYGTPSGDNCLEAVSERAWSSPIYLDWRSAGGEARPRP